MSTLLLLSGGGARGAFQVAPIEHILEHHGIDAVCGTSVGAINGSAVASLMVEKLREIWNQVEGRKLFMKTNLDLWKGLYQFGPLRRLLEAEQVLEDLKMRFHVGIMDMARLKHSLRRVDRAKKLERRIDMVLASSSIPLIHEVCNLAGRVVADGGIHSPLPIPPRWWKEYDEIHAVFCSSSDWPPEVAQEECNGAMDVMMRTLDYYNYRAVKAAHARLRAMKKAAPEKKIFVYEPENWAVVGPTFDADRTTILRRLRHGEEMVRLRREL